MSVTELSASDLQQILAFTTTLARKAGDLILEGSQAIQLAPAKDINEKKNSVDLVTEYDVKVEELVKKEISQRYPAFKLLVLISACVRICANVSLQHRGRIICGWIQASID
jgi:myo-inositol-1(or 4)-monophosphatase